MGECGETFMSLGKFKSFISWQSLFSCGQLFCFDPLADLLQDRSYMCAHPSAKMGFSSRAFEGVRALYYGLAHPPFLISKKHFCACAVKVFLAPKMGNMWPLDLLHKSRLVSSMPLPLASLPSVHKRQSPDVYPVSVVISISKYKQETSYKCLIT